MRSRSAVVVSALLVLAVVACGRAQSGGGSDWPGGRTFRSTAVTVGGADRPLVAGTTLELSFTDDRELRVRAGCNTLSGPASIAGGVLVVEAAGSTEMGCAPALMDQDSWAFGVLSSRPSVKIDGTALTLTTADTRIDFLDRQVVDPDRPILDTRWQVDTLISGGVASSVPGDAVAVLQLHPDGTLRATTGCPAGEVIASATLTGTRLELRDVRSTPCTTTGSALDQAVRAVLTAGPLTAKVTADRLLLTAPNGAGLGLHAS